MCLMPLRDKKGKGTGTHRYISKAHIHTVEVNEKQLDELAATLKIPPGERKKMKAGTIHLINEKGKK